MRLLGFTLLTIAIGTGIHFGLTRLPYYVHDALHGIDIALMFVLPVIVTAGLAYAMRISSLGYVIALAVFSPFVSWVLMFLIAVFVFNEHAYI